jgi:hypothetical protein
MLTVFSTPKPFRGHIGVIQRNAIESWKRLDPDIEIILFGDEEGTQEVCAEMGLRHEPHVERSSEGTKYVACIFERAQEIARHDVLCYANCDIVLMQDFRRAVERTASWKQQFLLLGRRWDVDVTAPLAFDDPSWQENLTDRAHGEGFQRLYYNIDYFVFRRGLYREIPPLVIGRVWWDHWLVWKANASGAAVVDASDVVCAVHQNHDYSYHPDGQAGVWYDDAAKRNLRVAGGRFHAHTVEDARYRLSESGFTPQRFSWLAPEKRLVRDAWRSARTAVRTKFWHPLLNASRSIRHAIGLDHRVLERFHREPAARRHPFDQ